MSESEQISEPTLKGQSDCFLVRGTLEHRHRVSLATENSVESAQLEYLVHFKPAAGIFSQLRPLHGTRSLYAVAESLADTRRLLYINLGPEHI